MNKEEFVLKLHDINAIKFGSFTLKSGLQSPFYFDLRDIVSYPELLDAIADLLVEKSKEINFDYVSGIPYTALPIATLVADKLRKPLIFARKEEKVYGTKNTIIGKYEKNKTCLIIDDLITSGESIIETAEKFQQAGLVTNDFMVIIDRSKNGTEKLSKYGFKLHSLIDIEEIITILKDNNRIDNDKITEIRDFINNSVVKDDDDIVYNNLTKKLINKIKSKKSRLVLSLDVDNQKEFFDILDQTAEHIVMLKTHIDILKDYDENFIPKLIKYSKKYNFLIFEDRKFADIGNTVKKQYQSGIYKISEWSDFITVHGIPGSGILNGLFDNIEGRSSFLLAKMSSKGNLMNDGYTRKVFDMGSKFPNVVSGYIVHANTSDELRRLKNKIPKGQLLLMPGVKLEPGTDKLGQQYTSVAEAIGGGADLIIVGRGIIAAEDPSGTAKKYRTESYK